MGNDALQPPEALQLTAETPRRRTGYIHPVPHYCAIYATKERGIKVWMERGRDAGDPPPLDDPQAMLSWWARHSTQRVPDKLTRAAARAASASPVGATPPPAVPARPAAAAPSASAEPSAPASRSTVLLSDIQGITLADAMPSLQRVLAHAIRDYELKAADPSADDASISLAATRLDKVLERHRKLESTLFESAQKRGDLVPVLDLRAELAKVFARLASSLVERLIAQLALPRAAALAFADGWFAQVRDMPHGDLAPGADEAAAA